MSFEMQGGLINDYGVLYHDRGAHPKVTCRTWPLEGLINPIVLIHLIVIDKFSKKI